MDSPYPYLHGAAEECNSSESGWTMYIGSPAESKEAEISYSFKGEFDDTDEEDENNHSTNHDENSDDSMASDASSGPSHRGKLWEISRAGKTYGAKALQNRRSNCRAELPAKKNRYVKRNEEKDEVEEVDDDKGGKFAGDGANKVRKNHGLGKKK